MPRDIDSTTDLGRVPLGLTRTAGRCNYQWAVEGPLGAVIFYCTNIENECYGSPHRVKFDSETDHVTLEFVNDDDRALRTTRTLVEAEGQKEKTT